MLRWLAIDITFVYVTTLRSSSFTWCYWCKLWIDLQISDCLKHDVIGM